MTTAKPLNPDTEARHLEKWVKEATNFWLYDFCDARGYSLKRLKSLCKRSARMEEAYAHAKEATEHRIAKMAAEGRLNGNFVKFVLSARHGWKEQTEQNVHVTTDPMKEIMKQVDGKTRAFVAPAEKALEAVDEQG